MHGGRSTPLISSQQSGGERIPASVQLSIMECLRRPTTREMPTTLPTSTLQDDRLVDLPIRSSTTFYGCRPGEHRSRACVTQRLI
jgi:hypothetical protein